jgi:hypothetical protein
MYLGSAKLACYTSDEVKTKTLLTKILKIILSAAHSHSQQAASTWKQTPHSYRRTVTREGFTECSRAIHANNAEPFANKSITTLAMQDLEIDRPSTRHSSS